MAGLVPAIHVFDLFQFKTWMPGTRPGMTDRYVVALGINPIGMIEFFTTLLPISLSGDIHNSFTSMFWAVSVEFQCYLIFPFLIAFSNRRGSFFLVHIIVIAFALRLLAVMAEGASPRELSYWTVVGRIDQFCIGIIAARLYMVRGLAALHPIWFLPAAAAAALMLWGFNRLGGWPVDQIWKMAWPTFEAAVWAAFIVTYIPAARLLPSAIAWIGAKIGEISYSMYLLHFAILTAIIKQSLYIRATGNGYYDALLTTTLVALPVIILISILTYHNIELPFLGLRRRYIVGAEPLASPYRAANSASIFNAVEPGK